MLTKPNTSLELDLTRGPVLILPLFNTPCTQSVLCSLMLCCPSVGPGSVVLFSQLEPKVAATSYIPFYTGTVPRGAVWRETVPESDVGYLFS